jgi:hypothetical protein
VAGTDITLVGYGRSCRADGLGCVDPNASVKRSGRNIADLFYLPIAPVDQTLVGKMFLYDFDANGVPSLTGGPSLGNAIETTSASGSAAAAAPDAAAPDDAGSALPDGNVADAGPVDDPGFDFGLDSLFDT